MILIRVGKQDVEGMQKFYSDGIILTLGTTTITLHKDKARDFAEAILSVIDGKGGRKPDSIKMFSGIEEEVKDSDS